MSEPVSTDPDNPSPDEPATDGRPIVDSSLPAGESTRDLASPHDRDMKEAADVQDAIDG